jgi:hypothetical protein
MRVEGWLLDVSFSEGYAVLWIRAPGLGRVKLRERYMPYFYAEPRGKADELINLLGAQEHVVCATPETNESSGRGWDRATPQVGAVHEADFLHCLNYLSERRLKLMGRVLADADEEGTLRAIYPVESGPRAGLPPLSLLNFEAAKSRDHMVIKVLDRLLRPEYSFMGPVREVVHDFLDYFADVDPDVVCCESRDLEEVLRLGRLYTNRRFGCIRGGRPVLWSGRIHVEPSTYRRLGLEGLVERARLSRALQVSASA